MVMASDRAKEWVLRCSLDDLKSPHLDVELRLAFQVTNADSDIREPLEPYNIESLFARRHILVTFKQPPERPPKECHFANYLA
jgi:hypothetical protein